MISNLLRNTILLAFSLTLCSHFAEATLKVVTTTMTLKEIVKEVGGSSVEVESLIQGNLDPHFLEAKPSYLLKLRKADLLVANGLELESSWLPQVQRNLADPAKMPGGNRYVELGSFIEAIEVPTQGVSRSEGDVHPSGNPHFHLDPERVMAVASKLADRLSALAPDDKGVFQQNATAFQNKLKEKMAKWKTAIDPKKLNGGVLTYHKTLNYFLDRFQIKWAGSIEPKPGVPPSAKHVMDLVTKLQTEKVRCVLNESFFESTAALRLQKEVPALKVFIAPSEVGSIEGVSTYFDLIDKLVQLIVDCGGK